MTVTSPPGQSARRAGRLPVLVWLAILVLSLTQLWMILATLGRPTPGMWGIAGWELVFGILFGSVGAVITARRPDSQVGWLLLGIGLGASILGIINWYPVLSDSRAAELPGVGVVRWLSAWAWVPLATVGTAILPLVFPDGHLPSRSWRPAVVLAASAALVLSGAIISLIEPIGSLPPEPAISARPDRFIQLLIGFSLFVAATAAAGASLVWRYRRADQIQRQQIKWVAYAFTLLVPAAAIGFVGGTIGAVIELAALVVVLIAIAIAVLRYRLYEIDTIINRTLVYGALSAILAGVYTASIALTQRVFTQFTGDRSDAAIVLTTLIVVSLFTPVKSRLQSIVDARLKTSRPGPGVVPAAALDVLVRLDQLRASGVISAAEFETAKQSLLDRAVSQAATEAVEA